MIGVVIPVHDEAPVLARCLAHVRRAACDPRLDGERVCICVALDACSDASPEIADACGAFYVVCNERNVGAARARAATLAIVAGARWLACTDADSEVPADWLSAQLACRVDVVCGIVRVVEWARRDPRLGAAYARHYPSRDGHRHVHGANLGLSVHAYRRAGGFVADACGEDVSLIRRLQALPVRIAWVARPCVVTSARHSLRCPGGFSTRLDQLEARLGNVGPRAGMEVRARAIAPRC